MADFENEWGIVGAGQNSNPKVTGIFFLKGIMIIMPKNMKLQGRF